MKRLSALHFFLLLFLVGCGTTLKTSSSYPQVIRATKIIAVMPADIHIYQLTAGGVREEMDEWNAQSKKFIEEKLKIHLAERFGFEIKFIDEGWLKANHKEAWTANRAMFDAISSAALTHAYSGANTFNTKMRNFDYTFGPDLEKLAQACGADALLFVYGFDHEATVARVLMSFLSAVGGVTLLNPSLMVMGLVEGKTGDVLWFKTSVPAAEYSFKNEKNVNTLVEWFTRDFLNEK